jgi:FdrA protein
VSVASRVLAGRWADSARLLQAAKAAGAAEGVEAAVCFMGTPANLAEAEGMGLWDDDVAAAGPDDTVIVVRGDSPGAGVAAAAAALERGGEEGGAREAVRAPRSLRGVAADLAVVSVPREYGALEAHKALGAGMDVLLFSDGVPVADEVALKRRAHDLGLLVMGPGAGTAILDGVALGFANVVPRGPVGVAAAAGTGAQEVTVLVGMHGAGVSACYGTGGRDLSAEVGAITMLDAIGRLAEDDASEVVLVVSKPPAPAVADRVLDALAATGKPGVACMVGAEPATRGGVAVVATLAEAAAAAARLAGAGEPLAEPEVAAAGLAGAVRGLFSGGTLCSEAAAILARSLPAVRSNAPAGSAGRLVEGERGEGHVCIDMGEEEYTRGRPHPMIDPTVRAETIAEEGADPATAVLLLDVVLGHGSHPDPAGELAPAIRAARAANPGLVAVAHVLGTEEDPQVRSRQEATLADAGVLLHPTNAGAAALAARIAAG